MAVLTPIRCSPVHFDPRSGEVVYLECEGKECARVELLGRVTTSFFVNPSEGYSRLVLSVEEALMPPGRGT